MSSNTEERKKIPVKNKRIFTSLQNTYKKFLGIRGNPHEIAAGFALGIFVGMSPTMGGQTAIALFFALLLKWNKVSSVIGVWISNPFTAPFIYSFTYFIGSKILGFIKISGVAIGSGKPSEMSANGLYNMLLKAPGIFWALIIGGIVIGLPLALAGYYFSFTAVRKYQLDIKKKLALRKEKHAIRKKEKKARKRSQELGSS
jgi:uncharacterized protein